MRNIKLIVNYPAEEAASEFIKKVTTETYIKLIEKVLSQSDLTLEEKKLIVDGLEADYHALCSL